EPALAARVHVRRGPRHASEDDDAATAEPARLHRPVRVRGLPGRVLGGDAQRQAAVARALAQEVEPVGALEDGADGDGPDLDAALRRAVVPAAHDRHRAAVADRVERATSEERRVDEAVDAV